MHIISRHAALTNTLQSLFTIILFLIVLFFTYFWFTTQQSNADNNESKACTSPQVSNYEIAITNSIFEGVNRDMQPYKISANSAVKMKDNLYKLRQINGVYKFSDDNLLIYANEGLIDDGIKLITLTDNVMFVFNGIKCITDKLQMNLLDKQVTGDAKVTITHHSNSLIQADKFFASGNTNIVKLSGNVKTKINISNF